MSNPILLCTLAHSLYYKLLVTHIDDIVQLVVVRLATLIMKAIVLLGNLQLFM